MTFNVLSWNAHSVRNKFTELSVLVSQLSVDIILISESWLTANDTFSIPNFSSYRTDRTRGGTAIFIKSTIPHFGFEKVQLDYAEASTISIRIDDITVKISVIYCSPSASRSQAKFFFDRVLNKPGPHIIAGDFNCKHVNWNNHSNDHKGIDLNNSISQLNYKIFPPEEPTLIPYIGEPSCVDFMISKTFDQISPIEVINDLSSDHLPLFFSLYSNSNIPENPTSLNLKKTNWKKFHKIIEARCHGLNFNNLSTTQSIDEAVSTLTNFIQEGLSNSSPRKHTNTFRYRYSELVEKLIKTRNHYRNLYRRSRDTSLKSSVNLLNRLIRQNVRTEKITAFEEKLKSLTYADNSLYQFAKSYKRKRFNIPPLKSNNSIFYSKLDKAEALATNFQKSFVLTQSTSSKYEPIVQESVQSLQSTPINSEDPISCNEVSVTLKFLNSRKACGPDNIPNQALSVLSSSKLFVALVSGIFNSCLVVSYFPDSWKLAKILPIPKKVPVSSDPDDFRPISLLSCLGKCFEKCLLKRLNHFEDDNQIFIQEQCGFRSRLSTVHQVIRITEKITFGFNQNKSTGIVLLDLKKAFDSVWHHGLIHKLIKHGYPMYLVKLINSYLCNRSAFVNLEGVDSSRFAVPCGVPQGSIISPHLFNIFINDIPVPKKGHLSLFADDTAFLIELPWKNLKSIKKELLSAVKSLQSFFNDWKIHLNHNKTEFAIFTKSTKMIKKMERDEIVFNNKKFSWCKSVKYLGVNLDTKLTFKQHVDYSISRAKRICYSSLYCLLSRKSVASTDSKIRIYRSYIRPILLYGCPVFANAAKSHIQKYQLLQNKLLRMILNVKWSDFMSTKQIHSSTKIPLVADFIKKLTDNFYKRVTNIEVDAYKSLGQYNKDSLNFRVKHKLPRLV